MTRIGKQDPDVVVKHLLPRPHDGSLVYQRYYLMALETVSKLSISPLPVFIRPIPGADRKVAALVRWQSKGLPSHCGRYEAGIGSKKVKFAVDARDSSPIHDPEILEWSDLYFKANKWPTVRYDPKVLPIVNGSGNLNWRNIRVLKSFRTTRKDLDFAFVANLWGGREHHVRLFEELVKLKCRKELLAIFPEGFEEQETRQYITRLERMGVPCSKRPLPTPVFWEKLARARIIFRRAGKHQCIPWGMIDLLCMGAAMVLDAEPFPQWPHPLKSGVNFIDCGIRRPTDTSPAVEEDYENVLPTVQGLLDSPGRLKEVGDAAIRYFEEHAAPEKVGEYVLENLRAHS